MPIRFACGVRHPASGHLAFPGLSLRNFGQSAGSILVAQTERQSLIKQLQGIFKYNGFMALAVIFKPAGSVASNDTQTCHKCRFGDTFTVHVV